MTNTNTRRAAANRANAALSTGPRSEHGKSVSSRNATSHGLTTDNLVIFHWESKAAYEAIQHAFHARFRPLDVVEASLVDRLVDTTWRRNRAIAIETTLMDLEISGLEEDLVARMPREGENGILRIAIGFRHRHGENSPVAIQRLISSLERSFSRARRELQILQKDRFNNISVEELLALSAATIAAHEAQMAAEDLADAETAPRQPQASAKTIEMKKRTHFYPSPAPQPQFRTPKEPGCDEPTNN